MLSILDCCYDNFRFGDKWLSDFGGIIYNEDGWKISNGLTSNKITAKLGNHDGELYLGQSYNPRTITIPIFIQNDIDIDEFYAWLLNGEQELEFEYSGRKINAVLDNQIDITSYYDGDYKGLSTLSFIAYNPYWRPIQDTYTTISSPKVNDTKLIKTESNVDSYPIIKITPSTLSRIKFSINDEIVELNLTNNNVGKEITIDCENEEIYDIRFEQKYNLFNIYHSTEYYDFPSLKPYVANKFKFLEGNVSEIKIYHNNRWL